MKEKLSRGNDLAQVDINASIREAHGIDDMFAAARLAQVRQDREDHTIDGMFAEAELAQVSSQAKEDHTIDGMFAEAALA